MRNVWRRMRNRLSQAVVSTCTTLVPTSRPFVCAASHRSSRHRLCNSLQQLRTRPTRPPFFRGHPVSGAFTRQITTDFRTLAREPPLCANACVTWLQGLPCTLVPRTFFFPFVVTTNSRTCPIRRACKSSSLIATLFPSCTSTPPISPALQKRSCDMCALCGFTSSRVMVLALPTPGLLSILLSRSACQLYHTVGDKVSHAINLCLYPRTVFISLALNGFP